ncbi:hypothetical protein [Parasitella parasitica]|uniref:Uncharacterized protein n=1 Tax=Parasitella parasitica TaxID=35722 RepID=A0A0B7MZY6_9FUNG|nr:hypothetical protein [Parasitella parasitica]
MSKARNNYSPKKQNNNKEGTQRVTKRGPYKKSSQEIRNLAIAYCYTDDNMSVTEAAKKLGVKRSTLSTQTLGLKAALEACLSDTAKTEKEELVLRIYKFILQMHVEKQRVFSKEYRSLYSEFDLQVKFRGYVFETYFGNNPKILLHWGDTMSSACKRMNLRFKLDLRLLVWKEDAAIFDGGTGEVAKKATTAKLEGG